MSNVSDAATIALFGVISTRLNSYITLVVFVLGTIGNLLSIVVLCQSTLRRNPCVLYFLASSTSSLSIVLVGLPSRLIAGWTSVDPSTTNAALCKIRIFLLYGFRTTSVWLIVLATVDRWLVSSAHIVRRRWSSRRIACRSLVAVHVLSFLLWLETIFCYDIDLPQAALRCSGASQLCRIFNDLVYASSTVIIPSVLMLTFGFLTIHNINRSRRAIEPFVATVTAVPASPRKRKRRVRRNESSLMRMLLLQVIFLTVFSIPQAVHQFYLTFTLTVVKSPLRAAIESFIVNFDFSLTYVGNASPFYIYILTGTVFRHTLKRLLHSIGRQARLRCASL